ncbi:MAG: tetratricopeptide repeat protein [Bacteroidota bacterium]|nr:tetratricopeptide repeat protein [Bacteroidota bacterium]
MGAGVWSFRKYRLISFGIFWFFLTISVTSGIIPIQDVMFEHRLYLPVLGMILIIITLLFRLMPQKNVKPFALIVLIIVLVFSGLTYARNDLWTSSVTNSGRMHIKNHPASHGFSRTWAFLISHKADYRNALRMFDKVIASDPEHYNARFNRANIRLRFQDYQGAIDDLEVFIRKYPKTLQAWQGLGKAHLELGNYDQAEKAYSRMIELDEDNALAHFERGRTRMMKKQYGSALEDFFIAKELNPTNAAIYNIIGQIHTYLDQEGESPGLFWTGH